MRPLLDSLFVSREKLAFIVDATAAPVASISPVSSWVGFEIGLIEEEIQKIIEQEGGEENLRIKTSGMAVFLQSIKYRYVSFRQSRRRSTAMPSVKFANCFVFSNVAVPHFHDCPHGRTHLQ